jgi:hypothetical protein
VVARFSQWLRVALQDQGYDRFYGDYLGARLGQRRVCHAAGRLRTIIFDSRKDYSEYFDQIDPNRKKGSDVDLRRHTNPGLGPVCSLMQMGSAISPEMSMHGMFYSPPVGDTACCSGAATTISVTVR